VYLLQGDFLVWFFSMYCFHAASSAAPQIPLCRRMLELLRLRHWQSDALTTRLDLIKLKLYSSSAERYLNRYRWKQKQKKIRFNITLIEHYETDYYYGPVISTGTRMLSTVSVVINGSYQKTGA
jgi:hypothetical protein